LTTKTIRRVGQITGTILTLRNFKTVHGAAKRLLARAGQKFRQLD
jgi:hypothetical protein